jgi:hypothetical protein
MLRRANVFDACIEKLLFNLTGTSSHCERFTPHANLYVWAWIHWLKRNHRISDLKMYGSS